MHESDGQEMKQHIALISNGNKQFLGWHKVKFSLYHGHTLYQATARAQGAVHWVMPAYSAYKQNRASFCLQV